MTRWEYHTAYGNPRLAAAELNTLGAEGWELVSTAPRGGGCLLYYFKRPGGA
jgi:hypothetical protein